MKIKNPKTLITWLLGAVVLGLYVIFATGCAAEMTPVNPEIGCLGPQVTQPAPDAAPVHLAV